MPLPHPLLLFDLGAGGMIPTPLPLAARGGSGDIAKTVEEVGPTDDRTEALMPETAAGSMEARALAAELGPCPPLHFVGCERTGWAPCVLGASQFLPPCLPAGPPRGRPPVQVEPKAVYCACQAMGAGWPTQRGLLCGNLPGSCEAWVLLEPRGFWDNHPWPCLLPDKVCTCLRASCRNQTPVLSVAVAIQVHQRLSCNQVWLSIFLFVWTRSLYLNKYFKTSASSHRMKGWCGVTRNPTGGRRWHGLAFSVVLA